MTDRTATGLGRSGSQTRGDGLPVADSYEEIYGRFHARVVRQLTYILGDRAAAEDVAQETFLKLYTVPPPTRQNIGGWLYQVGARLAFNYLRGEKRRQHHESEAGAPAAADATGTLEAAVLNQEAVRLVREALAELPPRDRLALLLRHTGFSYREIAWVIETDPRSVGTVLARAQRRFLEMYGQRKGDDE